MAVVKHSAQRVGIFIDTANLYHSAKNLYKSKVNFGNVVKEALGGRTLIRAIAYVIATEGGDEKAFFDALAKMGIETKSKDLQVFFGGAKKADWDVGITIDAVVMAPKIDVAIIVSGDGDYVPLIEYLKMMGVQVEVAAFGRSTSSKLREATESFLDLCDAPNKYLMRSSRSGGSRSPLKSAIDGAQENNEELPT
ncbi:MAG TPA: NYN domain-containing protein [Candidatus Paceibacterota bacterium]